MKHFIFIASILLFHISLFAQTANERLEIDWPVKDRWKLYGDNRDSMNHILQYAPQSATRMLWDTIIYVQAIRNIVAPNLDHVITSYSRGATKEAPASTFTVLEKDDRSKNFWVIYKIETPYYPNDPMPESQLYFILQGDDTFFVNFIAIKEKTLSDNFVAYWSNVFKTGKLIKATK